MFTGKKPEATKLAPERARHCTRWFHGVWALWVIAMLAYVVFAGRGGHPPGIILVPPIVLVWVLGHACIAVVQVVVRRVRRRAQPSHAPQAGGFDGSD